MGQVNGHRSPALEEPQQVDQSWRIRIELYLRENGTMFFRTSLRSIVRPNVLSQGIVEVQQDVQSIVLANILYMADEQGANYGDPHDSQTLYRMGVDALHKMMSAWNQEGRQWVHACRMADKFEKPLATVVIHP